MNWGPGMRWGAGGRGGGFGAGGGLFECLSSLGPIVQNVVEMFVSAGMGPGTDSGLANVSEETKRAARDVKDAFVAAENKELIVERMKGIFPGVKEWMMANLGDNTLGEAAVTELVALVRGGMNDVDDAFVGKVVDLVERGMSDAAVVHMLKFIPWDMPFDLDAHMETREEDRGVGFDVHRRVECDKCGQSPIRGIRYKATNRPNYDLCAACHETRGEDGMQYREIRYVWQADMPDARVPAPTLVLGDQGPRVAFLQKLLTDLGYMNEGMYRRRVGLYGKNTREAVKQMQREYGLEGATESGVYDATTAASLVSILESVPPTAAAGAPASASAAGDAGAGAGAKTSAAAEEAQG